MGYKYVIFDFDGTVANSSEGVSASICYALESFGIPIPPEDVMIKFFGPPLVNGFMDNVGVDEETAVALTAKYRELYTDNAMYLLELYDGVRELLEKLKVNGIKIGIASSKPKKFFDKLLEKLEITDYFSAICGAEMDAKDNGKKEIIENSIKQLGAKNLDEVIMVGDRMFDIEGAHQAGLKCIAVTYGFGTREEFEEYDAEYIVDTPEEIMNIVK